MESPKPNAVGQYDLLPFLRGTGETYITKNSWASDELMWTERAGAIWYQRKNDHSEECAEADGYIWRGVDDSPGGGYAYVLSNPDGSIGCVWCPRWMKPGEAAYYREAVVKFYELASGNPGPSYVDRTWLKFVRFYPTWKSYGGMTLDNVIELEAYINKSGVPGTLFERYFYGYGLGLVGWQGGDGMKRTMGIASLAPNAVKPARIQLSWYTGMELPAMADIIIAPNDSRWKAAVIKSTVAKGTNLRKQPNTSAAIVGSLEPAVSYTGRAIEAAFTGSDGAWYAVEVTVNGKLISAWARYDVVSVEWIASPPDDETDEERRKARLELYAMIKEDLSQIQTKLNILESSDERIEDSEGNSI